MHTIRLRGPLQVEPVERFIREPDGTWRADCGNLPPATRATMPADWSAIFGGDFLGGVRYRRTFQKPTGLESGERVFLVVEPPRSRGTIVLSDRALGSAGADESPFRFDIMDHLEDHNRLEIVVDHPALDAAGAANDDGGTRLPGGLVGEVRLEIEE
jgi:hypothetical protein